LSILGTSAIANTKISTFITELTAAVVEGEHLRMIDLDEKTAIGEKSKVFTTYDKNTKVSSMLMFATIIVGADKEVNCSTGGNTVGRFNLCGNFDDRVVTTSVSGAHQWQQFNPSGSCTFDVNNDCANTNIGCWSDVSSSTSFTLDASAISSATGAEYRVRVNSGAYYYLKVKKSTITQTFVKRDYICGVDGRIQITNLSSAYEYSIDSGAGFGAWQSSAIFNGLAPNTYTVKARLQGTPGTCEYLYEPIIIEQQDIDIDVTTVDTRCFGQNGSISVNVNNVPGPYKYTLLDNAGVPQEFTTFIPDNPYTFATVGMGTYSVQVETQQCKGDPSTGTPAPRQSFDTSGNPIVIGDGLVALSASTEVNNSFGCGVPSVDIIVRTSGGAPPYTFTASDGGSSTTSYTTDTTYSVTSAGSYDFVITDNNGCVKEASANVEELTPPVITASGTDGTCVNGGAKIDFTIGDAKGYNLSYRATPSDSWSSNPKISVSAGTYNNLQVRYQQGGFDCTLDLTDVVTVITVGVIDSGAPIIVANRSCNATGGIDGGRIEFPGPFSGGSGSGYVFSISGDDPANFSSQTLYENLAPGIYTPIIRDDGGCRLELTPIEIKDVDPPTAITFTQSNINCAAGTSDVELIVTSNAAIATYRVINPTPGFDADGDNTNTVITGLSTTTVYLFEVIDVNGCSYTASFSPAVVSSIRARLKSGGDTRVCFGEGDGTGTFIIDGFTNNYTYSIDDGINPPSPESALQNANEVNLPLSVAGTYTITVTDADTGCTDTASVIIEEEPELTLGGTVTPMSCSNGNRGSVRANPTGGWGGFKYILEYPDGSTVGPQSGRTFGNLTQDSTPGNQYILSVEDTEGCTNTFTFDLTPLESPSISLDTAASDLCYDNVDAATLVFTLPTTGVAPFEYRINGTLNGSNVFGGLTPNTYTIEVRDANNCRDIVTVTVEPEVIPTATIIQELDCGGLPGQIRVNITNGNPNGIGDYDIYEVSINGAPYTSDANNITGTSFVYSIPNDGSITTDTTYQFRIRDRDEDGYRCINESNVVTISPTEVIAGTAVPTNTVCGADNGIITLLPDTTQGIPPYTFSNDNGASFSSQNIFSGYAPGTYSTFMIQDSRGCTSPLLSATINTSVPVDATVAVSDAICTPTGTVGSIDVTNVINGAANYTYTLEDISGFTVASVGPTASTTANFPNLIPGTYTVITTDASGCEERETVILDQGQIDLVPIANTPPIDCATPYTAFVVDIVETPIPDPPYRIGLVGGPLSAPNVDADTHNFAGEIAFGTTYFVEVVNNSGCSYIERIDPIPPINPVTVTAIANTVSCSTTGNGIISYTVDGLINNPSNFTVQLQNTDTGGLVGPPQVLTNVTPLPYNGTFSSLPAGNYQVLVNDDDTLCDGSALVSITQSIPSLVVDTNQPALCPSVVGAGRGALVTVRGNGGVGPYEFAYVLSGGPEPTVFTTETTYEVVGTYPETYDFYVRDTNGCVGTFPITVTEAPGVPTPVVNVINQCTAVANYTVNVTTPLTTSSGLPNETFQYNIGSGFQNSPNFTVPNPGNYTIVVRDGNGCTNTVIARVFDFFAISAKATSEPTCNAGDGVITVSTTGGSGNFEFQLRREVVATGALTNVGPTQGTNQFINVDPNVSGEQYNILVIDLDSSTLPLCQDIARVEVILATSPRLNLPVVENISCNDEDDGSITVTLISGTGVDIPVEFILHDLDAVPTEMEVNNTGVFSNLAEATRYQVEVRTARGCTDLSGEIEVINPPPFTITASALPFACELGVSRFSSTDIEITVTNIGNGGPYGYKIDPAGSYETGGVTHTIEIVDNGAQQIIDVYAIDSEGCEFVIPTSIILDSPSTVSGTITRISPMNCEDPERIRVDVVGSTDFTIEDQGTSVALVPSQVQNSGSSITFDLPMVAGEYRLQINDTGGCIYPIIAHTIISPTEPTITISENKPISCYRTDATGDGALNIDITAYTGIYDYWIYDATDVGFSNGGDFSLSTPVDNGTGSINTVVDGNPAVISNLPGGNLRIVIREQGNPKCDGYSNTATIRTPSGPLDVSAVEEGNVSCNNNEGKIIAAGSGGWNYSPYEYRLLLEDTAGVITIGTTNYTELYPFNVVNEFENLVSGDYIIEIRDIEGCEDFFNITLDAVAPIVAGIREPSGLVCPAGNNAILEAYDPTTGDETTGTAGAMGGVLGAGYNYQLIYLGSNDIIDELSRSGLQNSPTFEGATGGFISSGWYAIEVSSSFDCVGVTIPYYVDSPPPIIPNLVQVRAPGCGGLGEMRLSIQNPEVGFEYEYRHVGVPDTDPFISMGAATSVLIPGNPRPSPYQYDVRKVSSTNICGVVVSNGVTLRDAQKVDLVINLPDDISCFSQIDGRIESFASGGVGNYTFTLYDGDPGTNAFSPSVTATIVQGPKNEGTFEGLEAGSNYYIAVTSGGTCGDVKKVDEIVRPAEIIVTAVSNPISCNGQTDGSIEIEVVSGGEGLIQFAIEPNFTEFFSDPSNPNIYVFTDLEAKEYKILIQDESGCDVKRTLRIQQPDELRLDFDSTPELCVNASDGTATVRITGGTPFEDSVTLVNYYETRVSGPGFIEPDPSDLTEGFVRNDDLFFDNLKGNETYVIFVRDKNGCTDNVIVPIGVGVNLEATAIPLYGCDGIFPNSTVRVEMEDTSILPDVLFYLEDLNAVTPPLTDEERLVLADTEYAWGDLPPSDYRVHIYHGNGCSITTDFTIDLYKPLVLNVVKTGPNEITAKASGGFGTYEYFFQGNSTGSENVYTLNEDAVLTAKAVDEKGCHITVKIPFDFTCVLEFPNFFTPNGDVVNEKWVPKNRECFPNMEVKIYDRYGRVVAILNDVFGWDGTYEGNKLPTGDYWYVVNQNDSENIQYIGHFTLYR